MYLYEDLLGFRANHKCKFQGQDSESLFMKNKAQMPDDWLYNTETISYDYNRLGHRCKNPEDIDFSNISFVLDKLYFMDIKVIEKGKDYARDQLHSGNITHQSISDYLISDYTDKYKNATIYSTFRGKSV